jgi:hypothetical protein
VTCDEALESASVALLTGESMDEPVQTHLAGCERCRQELARLAPLPAVLGRLSRDDLDVLRPADSGAEPATAGSPPGPALLDRLLAAAARERRARRARVLAVAAAAVLVLVVPLGVWGIVRLNQSTAPVVATGTDTVSWSATDASTGISGKAKIWKSAWGSGLTVSVSGVPSGTRCTIVVVTKDGARQTAASWQASYAGTAQVQGNVAAPVSTIARIDIVDENGKVLLRI